MWRLAPTLLFTGAASCAAPEQRAHSGQHCGALSLTLAGTTQTLVRVEAAEPDFEGATVTFEPVNVVSERDAGTDGFTLDVAGTEPAWVVGLAADTTYRYVVTPRAASRSCAVQSGQLSTGAAPPDLPLPVLTELAAEPAVPRVAEAPASDGYLVTSVLVNGAAPARSYLAAYDDKGRPVWWHPSPLDGLLSRVRWVTAQQRVFARDANPGGQSGGHVLWVAWDGSDVGVQTVDTSHHDFAVAPDGELLLLGGGRQVCGTLLGFRPGQKETPLLTLHEAFGSRVLSGDDPCHCNAVNYHPFDDSLTVSCLLMNAFVKLSRAQRSSWALDWVLGGSDGASHFTGDVDWVGQHGHQWLPGNRLLFFNNNGGGDSMSRGSLAVELQLDLASRTARRLWEYDGGEVSRTLGDVARLPNGNTWVGYSNAGVIHEVRPDRSVRRVWTFDAPIGYLEHHTQLHAN